MAVSFHRPVLFIDRHPGNIPARSRFTLPRACVQAEADRDAKCRELHALQDTRKRLARGPRPGDKPTSRLDTGQLSVAKHRVIKIKSHGEREALAGSEKLAAKAPEKTSAGLKRRVDSRLLARPPGAPGGESHAHHELKA